VGLFHSLQHAGLTRRSLYNAALQERRDAYQTHKKSLNYYDQANQLKEIRASGDLSLANYHCCQDVLKRIDKAFKAFFRRCKSGQKPGFPRFKSHRRYDSDHLSIARRRQQALESSPAGARRW